MSCAVYSYYTSTRVEGVKRVAEDVARTINLMSRNIDLSGVGVPDYLLLRLLVA